MRGQNSFEIASILINLIQKYKISIIDACFRICKYNQSVSNARNRNRNKSDFEREIIQKGGEGIRLECLIAEAHQIIQLYKQSWSEQQLVEVLSPAVIFSSNYDQDRFVVQEFIRGGYEKILNSCPGCLDRIALDKDSLKTAFNMIRQRSANNVAYLCFFISIQTQPVTNEIIRQAKLSQYDEQQTLTQIFNKLDIFRDYFNSTNSFKTFVASVAQSFTNFKSLSLINMTPSNFIKDFYQKYDDQHKTNIIMAILDYKKDQALDNLKQIVMSDFIRIVIKSNDNKKQLSDFFSKSPVPMKSIQEQLDLLFGDAFKTIQNYLDPSNIDCLLDIMESLSGSTQNEKLLSEIITKYNDPVVAIFRDLRLPVELANNMMNDTTIFKNRLISHFSFSKKTKDEAEKCYEVISHTTYGLSDSEKFINNLNGSLRLKEIDNLNLFRSDPNIKNLKYINDFRKNNT